MTTRVPSFSVAQRAIHFSALHNASVLKYQEQISSGQQFHLSSEDPISFRQVASMKSRLTELNADRNTIDRSTSILNASVSQVQDVIDIMTRAKSLTQQGIQSLDDDERESLAIEVDGLLEQLKQISLAKFNGKFLYGGTNSEDAPYDFAVTNEGNRKIHVNYNGSDERSNASVGGSIAVSTYYSGEELFGARDRGDTILEGETGAKAGAGTDTILGKGTLTVRHVATSYGGASGVQPAANSATDDTVIGLSGEHQLTIIDTAGDGSAGTIALNGSAPVEFTNADTALEVKGSAGQVVYVDASNITAGFNGTVDIIATGALSVDGGATEIPIDASTNQVITDSITERVVTIDSSKISKAGTEHLEFPGTTSAFEVLFELSNDLRNERDLDAQGVARSLDCRLGDLDQVSKRAFALLGEQSTSLQTLQTLGERVEDLRLDAELQISEVQATDIPEAVLRLENSQALLEYTYAVTAQLTSLSLLDFLR